MSREAPQLDRIERWMQSIIMHPNGVEGAIHTDTTQKDPATMDPEIVVLPSKQLKSLDRLSIYANMYFLRLIEVMSNEFPTVCHVLGVELFNDVVKDYVIRYPSTYYNLNRLGSKFPHYLYGEAQDIPYQKFVASVACVERAMEDVFDERYVERISFEKIQNIPNDKWDEICLQINPALRLLELDYPVNGYMTAVRENRHMDIPAHEKTYIVIYRSNHQVWREDLDPIRYTLLCKLQGGDTLGMALEACVSLSAVDVEKLSANLGNWFKEWASEEFFCGVI